MKMYVTSMRRPLQTRVDDVTLGGKADQLVDVPSRYTDQYDALKQRFEILNSEMEQFEKNQSRLLEKFSTQSTQCMNVINMMKELCDEKKSNRKKSKSTQEKEIATMGLQSSHVIKQTQFISLTSSSSRLHNTTQKPDIHVEVTQGRRTSTELYRDSGNTEYVPTKDTLTTITETLTSLTANAKENKMFDVQEVQTLESENEKIKNIRNVDITESKEELDYQENIMDNPKKETKSKPEKENTLKSERIKALEAGDKFALSEQDAQKEETVIEKISYHENITEIDGKLEQQRKTIHRPKYQKALSLNPTLQSIRKSYKAKDTKSKLEDVEQEGNENKLATLKNESLKLTDKNRTGKNKNIFEKGEDEYQEIESIISSENEKFLEESQLNSENTTEQKKEKLDILTN
ncbi:hypothetical protein FKM82_020579 [Ascaphus truei]